MLVFGREGKKSGGDYTSTGLQFSNKEPVPGIQWVVAGAQKRKSSQSLPCSEKEKGGWGPILVR